jgi:hypothetical protein
LRNPGSVLLAPPSLPPDTVRLIFYAGLLVVLLRFHSLTVRIDREFLRVRFGVGLVRVRYRIFDVRTAEPVRNRWWWGWGIRLLRSGLLFNVSGLRAVELVLRSGAVRRIGTDEPETLARAIRAACGSASEGARGQRFGRTL